MGQAVPERDIDRLLSATHGPGATATAAQAPHNEYSARLDRNRLGQVAALAEAARTDPEHPYARTETHGHALTIWDVPVFILYACLGIFARIWTDVTLYFDFGENGGFQTFAIGVSIALHMFIFAIIVNAWRGKWKYRSRNFLALAALFGYLGFRTLTQL